MAVCQYSLGEKLPGPKKIVSARGVSNPKSSQQRRRRWHLELINQRTFSGAGWSLSRVGEIEGCVQAGLYMGGYTLDVQQEQEVRLG